MSLGSEKFLKCSTFHNPSVIQNDYFIHVSEGRKAMGDTDDGSPFLKRIDGGLDLLFSPGIQSGGWLVEHKDRGVADECPSNRDTGFLPSGKKLTPLAAWRIVTVRHLHDEVVSIGMFGCLLDLLLGWILFAKTNVDANWQVKENDVFGVRVRQSGVVSIRTTD